MSLNRDAGENSESEKKMMFFRSSRSSPSMATSPSRSEYCLSSRLRAISCLASFGNAASSSSSSGCGAIRPCSPQNGSFSELLLNHQRLLAEDQVSRRLDGRQQSEKVLRPHHPIEQLGDRHARPMRSAEVDMERIEIQDEHAVARVARQLERVALRVGIAALAERRELRMIDELEGVDGLDFAIFEQLEVVLRQTEDRLAVARRVGIDPDVVRAGSKGRRRTLRIGLRS